MLWLKLVLVCVSLCYLWLKLIGSRFKVVLIPDFFAALVIRLMNSTSFDVPDTTAYRLILLE